MTINDQIEDEKLQYDIHRQAAKISDKIGKYEYLTGEERSASNQNQIRKQATFAYSSLGKAFEKQTKTTECQGKNQVDILKTLKPEELETIEVKSVVNEKHLKFKEVFNELSNERIYNNSKKVNFNNLTYHYKGSNTAPINFIDFKGPMHIYNEQKQ